MPQRFVLPIVLPIVVFFAVVGGAFATSSYLDPLGDVKNGAGPDITSVELSATRSTITFRIRFARRPPLGVSTAHKWIDMLLIGIDVPPLGPPPSSPGGEWLGADFALGTHGPSADGLLVRLGKQHSTTPIRFKVVTRGRALTLSVPLRALGNPRWFRFNVAAAREGEGRNGGGGIDVAPGRGTFRYVIR